MGKRIVLSGNESAAHGALLSRVEVVAAYPITPQSQLIETLAKFAADGRLQGKFVPAESEMGAIGYVIGAAAAGVRAFTATSSQGLAWMHEMLHYAAGARLPIVMVDVNRPFGVPWNLKCGQIDSLAQRDTGWVQLYCESNQEVLDTVIQAYRLAEWMSLPCMVCMDGVYLSYVNENVMVPDQDAVDAFLPPHTTVIKPHANRFKLYEKVGEQPPEYTEAIVDEYGFMRDRYDLNISESKCLDALIRVNEQFEAIFGRGYPAVEEYKCIDAEIVVVMSGSAAGTGRVVVDEFRRRGHNVGLVKFKMFRPFPVKLIRNVLRSKKKIAVIERDLSPGQCGIFYQEIKWALNKKDEQDDFGNIYGFISGLGGTDISVNLIEKAIHFTMENDNYPHEIIWLGLPGERSGEHGTVIS